MLSNVFNISVYVSFHMYLSIVPAYKLSTQLNKTYSITPFKIFIWT